MLIAPKASEIDFLGSVTIEAVVVFSGATPALFATVDSRSDAQLPPAARKARNGDGKPGGTGRFFLLQYYYTAIRMCIISSETRRTTV